MPLLAAQHITKRFPGVTALSDVSFELEAGEIHALCGENGAGKSTLIKLLSGLHPYGSYEGDLLIDGRLALFHSVADAERAGVAVIYQELALVPGLTVAENIFLGREPRRLGLVDWHRVFLEAQTLLSQFGVCIDPGALCEQLGVGQRQLVEIVKALAKKSRILILDEPTAALAEHEVETLLRIVRELRQRGIACIYISHRLDEVFALADRITTLRDGSTISTVATREATRAELIRQMVGREISDLYPRHAGASGGEPLLQVENLTVAHPRTGAVVLHEISFAVAAGEVLGFGGLMGAGRTELLMHLFGAWGTRVSGRVLLHGRELPPGRPRRSLRRGLALVSEDRRRYGLVLEESIHFNLSLSSLRGALINHAREYQSSERTARSLQLKAPGLHAIAGRLSGGNQQKVVLGRTLLTEPRVVLLDEPTRGIDVGAKIEIYEIINRLTAEGKAVILVSSELPELMGMSDRILMLHEGRVTRAFTREEATPEQLLEAAMGPLSA